MTRQKAERIAQVMNVLSIVCAVGVLFPGVVGMTAVTNVFSVLGFGCFLAGLGLWLRYPQTFHYDLEKELQKKGLDRQFVSLSYPLMVPGLSMSLHFIRNENLNSPWQMILAVGLLFVALCVLLFRFIPALREAKAELLGAALLIALSQFGTIYQANALLDLREPELVEAEVLEKDHYHSKGGWTYYFDTELEGGEVRFYVTVDEWYALDAGDTVTIAIHSGGLGMEYYTLEEP